MAGTSTGIGADGVLTRDSLQSRGRRRRFRSGHRTTERGVAALFCQPLAGGVATHRAEEPMHRSTFHIVALLSLAAPALLPAPVEADGSTTRVSVSSGDAQGDGASSDASVTHDGRFIAFTSGATNLVVGDTNGHYDVFVHDRITGETERVSVSSGGAQGDAPQLPPLDQRGWPLRRLLHERIDPGGGGLQRSRRCLRSRPGEQPDPAGERVQQWAGGRLAERSALDQRRWPLHRLLLQLLESGGRRHQ